MPILKVPIHVSYLLYLSVISPALALHYFKMALALCRFTGTQPSLLLHPLDFLGGEEVPELSFFPAMGLSVDRKMELVREVIRLFLFPIHGGAPSTTRFGNFPHLSPALDGIQVYRTEIGREIVTFSSPFIFFMPGSLSAFASSDPLVTKK